jgi:hypothetical protein
MKNSTIIFFLLSLNGFSQLKSTPIISLNSEMTAQFTLDSASSKVTLVLTGPSNKWSSLGVGTTTTTSSNDVYAYTRSTSESNEGPKNTSENWSTIANTVNSGIRKVTLERTLTNSDLNDFQLAFDTTNSIDIVWSRTGTAVSTTSANRGATTVAFTTLGVNDVSVDDETILYPNPSTGELFIKSKTNISKVNIYSQTGSLLKNINFDTNSNEVKVNTNDLPKGLYHFELQNESKNIWKKVIVN